MLLKCFSFFGQNPVKMPIEQMHVYLNKDINAHNFVVLSEKCK